MDMDQWFQSWWECGPVQAGGCISAMKGRAGHDDPICSHALYIFCCQLSVWHSIYNGVGVPGWAGVRCPLGLKPQ